MINETVTTIASTMTEEIIRNMYASDGLSGFQILLITMGFISLLNSFISIIFNSIIVSIAYFIGFIKWGYDLFKQFHKRSIR